MTDIEYFDEDFLCTDIILAFIPTRSDYVQLHLKHMGMTLVMMGIMIYLRNDLRSADISIYF